MRILILGATGKTGLQVVKLAVKAGHTVTAYVRSPNKLPKSSPNLRVTRGDVFDEGQLAAAMKEQDAVISTLGSSTGAGDVVARSSQALVEAAGRSGLERVIMMSSFFMAPGYKRGVALKMLTDIVMKKMVRDKAAGEEHLRTSKLEWTIVYCVALTNGPLTRQPRVLGVDEAASLKMKISRADVAQFLLSELSHDDHVRNSVTITSA